MNRILNVCDIWKTSNEDFIKYLRSIKLLLSSYECNCCSKLMSERRNSKSIDGCYWKCSNKQCRKYKNTVSIRAKSVFEQYKLCLRTIWTVFTCWLLDIQSKDILKFCKISKRSIVRINKSLQDKIMQKMSQMSLKLGGENVICQIDESLLSHKSKYNRGRFPRASIWCFGIVDTSYSPAKGYVQIVEDRSRATLFEIINKICLPGTIIHSDEWRAYSTITRDLGFQHLTVNHSVNFVNPETGVHTQHVESYWNRLKKGIKAMKGICKNNLNAYLSEFMWKDIHRERKYEEFLDLFEKLE